jgi:transcription antitermination factor NusG
MEWTSPQFKEGIKVKVRNGEFAGQTGVILFVPLLLTSSGHYTQVCVELESGQVEVFDPCGLISLNGSPENS